MVLIGKEFKSLRHVPLCPPCASKQNTSTRAMCTHKHINTWTVTCTHATCAAVEACTLGRYLVLPTVSHTCTLSMASCSAVMVAGLQGWCCVSVQRGISGYRRQHSGAWHVSHPLITPVVCTNTYSTYLITAQHATRAGSKKHTNETATESRFTNARFAPPRNGS